MTEEQLQRGVTDMCGAAAWWWWHATDPTMSTAGLPDVLAIHRRHRVVLLAELKTETGPIRPAQRDVLDRLRVGDDAPYTAWGALWRPSVYDDALAWMARPDGPPPTVPLPPAPAPRGPYPLRHGKRRRGSY